MKKGFLSEYPALDVVPYLHDQVIVTAASLTGKYFKCVSLLFCTSQEGELLLGNKHHEFNFESEMTFCVNGLFELLGKIVLFIHYIRQEGMSFTILPRLSKVGLLILAVKLFLN